MQPEPFPNHKITETGENLSHGVHFFRSLLEFAATQACIVGIMRVLVVGISRFSAPSGLCRYTDMLCRGVSTIDSAEVSLAVGSWQKGYFRDIFNTHSHTKLVDTDVRNDSLSRNAWYTARLPELVRQERADIVHFAYPVPFLKRFDCPTAVTVHDLYPFEVPENFKFPLANRTFLKICLRGCNAVVCISRTTLRRLQEFVPDAGNKRLLAQIYNPIASPFLAAQQPAVRSLQAGKFILTVGQHRPNKNIDLLQRTFSRLRNSLRVPPDWKLVIVGSEGPQTVALRKLTRDLALTEEVIYLSAIPECELAWLYGNCALAAFPSSHEGLCMPLAEALSAGSKVVCSDIPTLREIGGESCSYFQLRHEPIQSFVAAIVEAVARPSEKGWIGDAFTLRHFARQINLTYQAIAGPRRESGPFRPLPARQTTPLT